MPQIIGDPDNLITAITHLAESDAHKKVQDAKEKAAKIQEQGEQASREERDRILEQARRQAAAIRKKSKTQEAREENLAYLQAREQALEAVWDRAEEVLRDLTEQKKEYTETLKTLVLLGAQILESESLILYPEAQGRALLTEDRLKRWSEKASDQLNRPVTFSLAEKDADIWGGILIQAKDANKRIDASFETRLQIARDEIQNIIFRRLAES